VWFNCQSLFQALLDHPDAQSNHQPWPAVESPVKHGVPVAVQA
jgi:hypothetical protein